MTRYAAMWAAAAAGLVFAGCGGNGATGTAATGTGSATGSGTHAAAACEPVGEASRADATAEVVLDEWSVQADAIPPGTVTLEAINEGEEPHELVVVRADAADTLPVAGGKVEEDQLPSGAFIGEIEAFPSGQTCDGTFDLPVGDYVLFCNIVEQEDGQTESHFELGMRTEVTVE